MKTLVLNVDRDDDFGRKAKVTSPIIGLKDNIDAANKLGQSDPEDSDLNAIFSAIATYKQLKDEDKQVEIATICGHIHVGIKSDEILAEQLEKVIEKTGATEVILLSDGAEDEHILPIIQSRIKITSVKRVSIKQSKELEDAYYRILKLLGDEKVLKQFVLPVALVLIVWSIFVWLDMTRAGFGAMLLLLGSYLLIRVYRLERRIVSIWDEIKSGFLTGKISIYTSILAIMFIAAGGVLTYYSTIDYVTTSNINPDIELIPILYFVSNMVWAIVIAGMLIVFGRVVDTYAKDKKNPWRYWIVPFSLLTFGFITSAVTGALYKALLNMPNSFTIEPFTYPTFIGFTTTGILIGIIGAVTNHYVKEMYFTENMKIEIEKETATLVEKN